MTLVLTEPEIERLVDMQDLPTCIDLIERCYRDKAKGETALQPRLTMQYPPEDGYYVGSALRVLAGMVPNQGSAAIRTYPVSHPHGVTERGSRPLDYTMGQELLLYYRYDRGMELAAIMADYRIMNLRTAAPTGVATDALARGDSTTLGVIGAGRHAPWQIAAVCAVRPITEVRVFSPTAANRERLAADLHGRLDAAVQAVSSAEEAVAGADVVVTVTNANRPVVDHEWLAPGAHVNVIARGELDEATVAEADVITCSWREQILRDTPDFTPVPQMVRVGSISEERFLDLDQVLVDPRLGRASPQDLTLFLSQGVGLWDAAVAPWVYEAAIEQGLGVDVAFGS